MNASTPMSEKREQLTSVGTGAQAAATEWSGSLCPIDPDNFWIDDETGERVNAWTGERTAASAGTP